MRTMTAANASRGYLLAWLGGVAGMVAAIVLTIAAAQLTSGMCGPSAVVCGIFGGFIVAGFLVVWAVVAGIVAPIAGIYLVLRIAGREVAGLTAWFVVLGTFALIFVNRSVGPFLEGDQLDGAWTFMLIVAIVTLPLSARHLALRTADSLRKYRP
jgi:hypothetical protein